MFLIKEQANNFCIKFAGRANQLHTSYKYKFTIYIHLECCVNKTNVKTQVLLNEYRLKI